MKTKIAAFGLITLLLLSGTVSIACAGDWPMFQHDSRRTGYTEEKVPDSLELIWSFSGFGADPAVAKGKVFIASEDFGSIYCLDANTGDVTWSYEIGERLIYSPVVTDGKVFFCSFEKGNIYCLDEDNGDLIWSYETGSSVGSSPAEGDGKFFVSSGDTIYSLDASTGELIWNYKTEGRIDSGRTSLAVAEGKVFVAYNDDKLYCLDANTGKAIWNWKPESRYSNFGAPTVAEGKVIFLEGHLFCLNANTGNLIWSNQVVLGGSSSPAVADGKVFVNSAKNKVHCVDVSTGNLIWTYEMGYGGGGGLGAVLDSSPAVADDKVFVGNATFFGDVGGNSGKLYFSGGSDRIYCLNMNTGNLVWSYEILDGLYGLAVADGRVFVSSGKGITCFGAKESAPKIPAGEEETETPGFEMVFTFVGILAVAYLLRRSRK